MTNTVLFIGVLGIGWFQSTTGWIDQPWEALSMLCFVAVAVIMSAWRAFLLAKCLAGGARLFGLARSGSHTSPLCATRR